MNESSFCPHCGNQVTLNANFCSSCGAVVLGTVPPPGYAQGRIARPRSPRMIAGVCSGIALFYGWEIALVRILFAVCTVLTSGFGVIVYLIAWIVIPEALYALPFATQSSPRATSTQGTTA